MTKNRRFPFERTKENISLENFSTTNQQLYSIIREYASIGRFTATNNNDQTRYLQQEYIPNEDNSRLNQLIHHLKHQQQQPDGDSNISDLRYHNLQRWKYVKSQWQKYYHNEIKKQQEIFDNLIKSLPPPHLT